ncbi:MAG: fimbrillin family protein [Bacteroidales bacterium]|nr:fimbrillin family protein [Bacteroidales bacterium]
MKTYRFIVFALSMMAVVSCDIFGGDDDHIANGTIGFSRLSFGSIKTKSSEDLTVKEYSFQDNLSESSFNIIRTEDNIWDYEDVATKATAMDASHLLSFHMDGFLDKEAKVNAGVLESDKNNLHFIDNEVVTKTDEGKWAFVNEQNWRYGLHHYFWGFYPEVDLSFGGEDFTKASFDYVSNSEDDLILSYTPRYYGKETEDESLRKNSLSLEFNHALSAVRANTDAVVFKIKDSKGVPQDPKASEIGRGELLDVSYRGKVSGSCDVTGTEGTTDLDFVWSVASDGTIAGVQDKQDRFMIPQNSKEVLTVFTVRDNIREVTRQYPYPSLLGDGKTASGVESFMWDPGKRYFYDISGSFVLPYLSNTSVTGMDFGFSGNKLRDKLVIDNLDAKYVKSIEVSWTGVPTSGTHSNGTFGYISIEPRNADGTPRMPDFIDSSVDKAHEFIVGDYYLPGNQPNTSNPNIGFIYNLYYGREVVGNASPTAEQLSNAVPKGTCKFDSTDPTKISCSCIIEIPQDWTNGFDIYAFYYGGDNSACTWKVHDFSVIIHDWR